MTIVNMSVSEIAAAKLEGQKRHAMTNFSISHLKILETIQVEEFHFLIDTCASLFRIGLKCRQVVANQQKCTKMGEM